MISNDRVVGQDLADSTCELAILVVNQIVVRTSAVDSPALQPISNRRRLEVGPCTWLAVDASRVCEVVRSSRVGTIGVAFEDGHVRAERRLRGRRVGVEEVLEPHVVEEGLGVEGLLSVDLAQLHDRSLEDIASAIGCHCQHPDCFCSLAVADLGGTVAGWTQRSGNSADERVFEDESVVVGFVAES